MAGAPIIPTQVKALFPGQKAAANLSSIETGLQVYGEQIGLLQPHRLAQFLTQLAHETAGFVYDEEIWGPTPAQQRYDTRTDLGNTPEKDGDGKKYKGRTGIQLTGKANVTAFRDWCRRNGLDAPDFVEKPELLNTDPWEGVAPIWYWVSGNPTGASLNKLADANNIEQITKRVNGGLNGFEDRLKQYSRIALALAGFTSLTHFQRQARAAGLYDGAIDGDSGPKTRAALHKWLAQSSAVVVPAGPVVEEKPVVPEAVEKQVTKKFSFWGWLMAAISSGGLSLGALAGMDWQAILALGGVAVAFLVVALLLRGQIVSAVREIRAAVEASNA